MNLSGKTIFVTGAYGGFLGTHLTISLLARGAKVHTVRSCECDLTKAGDALEAMQEIKPDLVIHAAARVGGILANKKKPYTFGRDNLTMGINLLDAAIAANVEKFVLVSTTCAYPEHCKVPFEEDALWNGSAEPTNAPYGHAKRLLGDLVAAAVREGKLQCGTTAILANLYGPGDSFDPITSHSIPAMIRRLCEAVDRGLSEVTCWGSGKATRDFLHVRDAAEGIFRVCEAWDIPEPVNLGTGREVSIRDMAEMVADIVGFTGRIHWSPDDGLDGQRRRALDCTRAWTGMGWEPQIAFRDGLEETVYYWREKCTSSVP